MRAPYWRIASPATGGFTRRVASASANSTARCNCTSPRRVFGQLQSLLLGELHGLQVSSAVIARDCDTRRLSRAGGLKRTAGLLPVSLENLHSLRVARLKCQFILQNLFPYSNLRIWSVSEKTKKTARGKFFSLNVVISIHLLRWYHWKCEFNGFVGSKLAGKKLVGWNYLCFLVANKNQLHLLCSPLKDFIYSFIYETKLFFSAQITFQDRSLPLSLMAHHKGC